MNNFTRLLVGIGLTASVTGSAMAAPVISLPEGPLYIKFDNREQIAVNGATTWSEGGVEEINWGVLLVSNINIGTVTGTNVIETTGASFFNNISSHNAQITGMFYGIEGLAAGTGGNAFPSTGGYLDLWWRDLDSVTQTELASAAPTVRTGYNTATGFTEGTFLGRLMFASGILSTDSTVFIAGSVAPTEEGFAGLATSYGNIDADAGGAWATSLDTDWFTTDFGTRDMRFRNIYETLNSWDGGENIFGARSTDPATAYAVPEPATLALVGMGLIGFGLTSKRRKVK